MKEHLKGVSSSLVLIDDIHLYVLKLEGPQVPNRRSDNAHKSIDKVSPPSTPSKLLLLLALVHDHTLVHHMLLASTCSHQCRLKLLLIQLLTR